MGCTSSQLCFGVEKSFWMPIDTQGGPQKVSLMKDWYDRAPNLPKIILNITDAVVESDPASLALTALRVCLASSLYNRQFI